MQQCIFYNTCSLILFISIAQCCINANSYCITTIIYYTLFIPSCFYGSCSLLSSEVAPLGTLFGLLSHCIMRVFNLSFHALFRNLINYMSRIGKTMVVSGYINMLWLLCMGYCFITTLTKARCRMFSKEFDSVRVRVCFPVCSGRDKVFIIGIHRNFIHSCIATYY